ncbi:Zn-dependent oxidoreductase, NADPH:quinone reductase [secondary endosymbiont of Heteropsylla cubana]|uniref:NADPH:quinone reductase n=1 Tax=secondary endosymbiont of Heteropsylla cubana TaxID=134287 RepID=J3Z5Y0_9ENTR|nr:NADPH:quinone reductase [secondary endosymbiont of Heteropsylla cubana]AFP85774.1 Zn-dependent oxidoreductase, NADPH:quinone reductase [secondary endosymbiont of Heteropsylla cubana]
MTKRIQFREYGGPEVMECIDFMILNPSWGEVQIENKAIGVNYIDIYTRKGLYSTNLPSGLGTEAAGVVKKVGPGVDFFFPGDRVVYAQAPLGAYSSIHNVPANKLVHLPNTISFQEAAAVFLKGLTVFYLLYQTYKVKPNEVFLFHAAAGGVGYIACQWSKLLEAKMIATVGSESKATLAKEAGAWETINYRKEDVFERVLNLTNGSKVNVVYDSVGQKTWESSLDCLSPRGLMVSFGNSSGPVTGVNLSILNEKGSLFVTRPSINSYISNYASLKYAADKLFSMIAKGLIKVDVPKEQIFPLSSVKQAHQALEARKTSKSLLLIP